jgi:hypothetical protein
MRGTTHPFSWDLRYITHSTPQRITSSAVDHATQLTTLSSDRCRPLSCRLPSNRFAFLDETPKPPSLSTKHARVPRAVCMTAARRRWFNQHARGSLGRTSTKRTLHSDPGKATPRLPRALQKLFVPATVLICAKKQVGTSRWCAHTGTFCSVNESH